MAFSRQLAQIALDEHDRAHQEEDAVRKAAAEAAQHAAGDLTALPAVGPTPIRLTRPVPALTVVIVPGAVVNPGVPLTFTIEARPAHIGQLVELVADSVGAIFVTEAAAAWLELPATPPPGAHPFLEAAQAAGFEVSPAALGWQVRVRRPAGGRAVPVVFLGWDFNGYVAPWSRVDDAAELVAGLAAFRFAVGASFGPSIGATGEALVLASHPKKAGGAKLDPTPAIPRVIDDVAETSTTWRRPLTEAETAAGFVHWYDANANYLSAYQVAGLGRGEPVQHRVNVDELLTRYLPAGLWRVALPALEDELLPAPWSTTAGWHTSPTIARALELGVDVAGGLVEAWIWPKNTRYLEPFGALMRDARRRLLEAPATPGTRLALAAVAAVYQRLHGRLGAGFRAGSSSSWARPDWMHTIRAQARVNLDRRTRSLTARPFAVDVDALYFASDVEDATTFADTLAPDKPLLGPRGQLGRFRVAGSVAMTTELRDALAGVHTAAATRELLRAAAAGQPLHRPAVDDTLDRVDQVDDVDDLLELSEQLRGDDA